MVDGPILPLAAQGVSVTRGPKILVGPLDLELGPRGLTTVIGPNGAGKTSLLRLLHGLERPRGGQMHWAVNMAQVRAAQGFVFQSPVMMRRSVLGNLAYPLLIHGVAREQANEQSLTWLKRLYLVEYADRPAAGLSGGEKQKLALARALIRQPQLLFLDEPCASLDGAATAAIEGILTAEAARGTRIVMATHDMGQARRLSDDVIFLHRGAIVEHAPSDRFFDHPETDAARAFLNGEILK